MKKRKTRHQHELCHQYKLAKQKFCTPMMGERRRKDSSISWSSDSIRWPSSTRREKRKRKERRNIQQYRNINEKKREKEKRQGKSTSCVTRASWPSRNTTHLMLGQKTPAPAGQATAYAGHPAQAGKKEEK